MSSLLTVLRDFLWPPACPGCRVDLAVPELCPSCQRHLLRLDPSEASPLDLDPLSALRAPFRYEGLLRRVLLELKYGGSTFAGPPLGTLLAAEIEGPAQLGFPDCVIPMPLSRRRQRDRGFNQSRLLAHPTATALGLPLLTRELRRRLHRPPQASLGGRDRRRNLPRGSFEAHRVLGRSVLLVDDVVTTGSTLRAAASALMLGGARRVTALCLCRARPEA